MSDLTAHVAQNPDEPRPVLVATDFSADSAAALLWAAQHVQLSGAPLLVLHVVHDPAEAAGFYRRDEKDAERTMSEVANEMMNAFLKKMRNENPGITPIEHAKPELVVGLPPTRIIEVAEREGAQLIVIGSRGLSGLSGILIGSVAERVAQLAPVPVVIVKDQASR